jgi:hypothetical protein
MRIATSIRLLLAPAALLAAACDDADAPLEPPAAADEAPLSQEPATLATGRWADGYLLADQPTHASYSPNSGFAYSRSGGGITITKPAGTTGRYVAIFSGLSAVIGTKSTVHVTGYGYDDTYCKPVGGYLVSDKVEVRCYMMDSGTPTNSGFSLVVLGKTAGRASAFAHQPTATNYAPATAGSWNPAGTTKVIRSGVGQYEVVFGNLGSATSTNGGQVQVTAVGTGKAHCKMGNLSEAANVHVYVRCYTPAGAAVDAKFNVLFQVPAAHLAYALANEPTTREYSPDPFWSSNPAGGAIYAYRYDIGEYEIHWAYVDPAIIDYGNVQVTAFGTGDAHCKVVPYIGSTGFRVRCFGPNHTPADTWFAVLWGS